MEFQQPRWLQIFNAISTTNARIAMSLLVILGTAVTYWIRSLVPAESWLIFLVALSGVDAAQYASKRFSDSRRFPQNNQPPENVTTTTDIRELSQQKG